MIIKVMILATIGAFIGWMTNVFAIKLMFRPLEPFKLPLLPIKLQGLIPKRRMEIAQSIGETVEKELLCIEDIIEKLSADTDKTEIIGILKNKTVKIVEENMPSIVPSMFKGMIGSYVSDIIDREGENIINDLSQKMIQHATEKVSIASIIEEKINEFELEKLETIILDIAKRELKHIELLGGLIGFLIGIVQGLIIIFL